MIFHEGPRGYLAFPVWARGGQAPLRVQTFALTGHVCRSGRPPGCASPPFRASASGCEPPSGGAALSPGFLRYAIANPLAEPLPVRRPRARP